MRNDNIRLLVLTPLALALAAADAGAQRSRPAPAGASATPFVDASALAALKWRFVGPEGNRTTSVAGIKGDINTYYAGAASGGIWKTVDAGAHWAPIFDGQPVSSIGALAVAPSDPNVVWVGTGEPFIRSHISLGWGMYRSADAGKTWARAGLENSGRIARIAVDPGNADRVLVAAEGHAYGPQPDRGIYRTLDGGKTWERVLFVNDSTGGVDVLLDPNNARIVYAALWQIEIHTWGRESGGAGSSIWKSTDFGATWKRLVGHGLPEKPYGKVGLGVSAANSNRVYAEIETGDGLPWHGQPTDRGHIWRSDDAGETWQLVNEDRKPGGRTAYYNRMAVEPDNADEVYFLAADWTKTLDGGKHIIDVPDAEIPRGDHHDVWFDPSNGNRFIVAHDGGVAITTTRGRSWFRVQLPIAQMYHVMTDDAIPYNLYGNKQDGPSVMGPSNSKVPHYYGLKQDIWRGLWRTVGGGEDGWATPDPVDTNLVWSSGAGFGAGGGVVVKWNRRTNIAQQVCDLRDVTLEETQRVRVRDHEHGGLVVEIRLQLVQINEAVGTSFELHALEAGDRRTGGIRAVSALREEHLRSLFASIVKVCGRSEQRGHLAMSTCRRLQRDRRQSCNLAEHLLQLEQDCQHPLLAGFVLVRMQINQAR